MSPQRGYKRRLPAGIVDAGFASLATFAVGLSAVTLFGDADRGVYAVFFSAFMLGTVLPRNLILTPVEVEAVAVPVGSRLTLLPRGLILGFGPAVLGATAVLFAVAVTTQYTTADVMIALAVTTAVTTVLSPLQDYVRKMFHIATLSWRAAAVSIVQFVSVAAAIAVMMALDVGVAWIPFGALAIANAISLVVARLIVHLTASGSVLGSLDFRELASRGKWLVVQASASAATGFAVAAIIASLASPDALGYAESARVVAQPILVLAAGLTAVLAPRSMKAGMDRDARTARTTNNIYLAIIGLAGIGYIAIAGWDWLLNPMSYIVPSAYVVSGLVVVTIAANVVVSGLFLQVNELLGAHEETALARIAWSVSPLMLLGGLTAGATGAFARPVGAIAQAGGRFLMQAYTLRRVYRADPEATPIGDDEVVSDRADRE